MTFVEKEIRAVFNRLDAEPGATRRHSKNPPVSPLRKGGKRSDAADFPPLAKGGRGVRAGACNASENRSDVHFVSHSPVRSRSLARQRGWRWTCETALGWVEHSEVLPIQPLPAAAWRLAHHGQSVGHFLGLGLAGHGKLDGEGGSLAGLRGNGDRSAVLGDDLAGDRQSQAGPA